jgi:outer membrane protein assembly factor BamD (BamD/ComL family)
MMRALLILLLVFSVVSCSSDGGADELKTKISEIETKLSEQSSNNVEVDRTELIKSLKSFYQKYPENEFAANCLNKLHLIHSANRDYETAAAYADTLLEKYPKFPERVIILESQSNAYDMSIKPRNKEKVKKYLQMLLDENPDMDAGRRKDVEYRLKYIDLTIEQLISMDRYELK